MSEIGVPDRVLERIADDLGRELAEPVLGVRPIPEGHSGFTYWVDLRDRQAVLRLPPPGTRPAGPADIARQGRLLRALHAAGIAVPEVLAMSERPIVDGRPYCLMARVEGDRVEAAEGHDDAALAHSAVEELLRLQALPRDRTGIAEEAPVALAGEIERWTWLLERSPKELVGRTPEVRASLHRTAPPDQAPVMVHGDYHYGNMLFRGGRLAAVLDWEIAELGQPLLDLACMVVVGQAHRGPAPGVPGAGSLDVDESDLLRWYGVEPDRFRWPLALTFYKYAAIFGYNLMLHRRGKRPDPTYESRTDTIVAFLDEAARLLTQGGRS
ncbi:MAG: phosphotransferase family protein [Candidatus Dormibacteraeota bacterium]|nr:phosphotransferase family protein [Candidatus Dormibacteraeota bacterium]